MLAVDTATLRRRNSLDVVHGLNGSLSLGFLSEANKAKTTAPSGVAVLDYDLCNSLGYLGLQHQFEWAYRFLDRTILLEFRSQGCVVGVPC